MIALWLRQHDLSQGTDDEPDLEIEIVNPEAVSIETEDGRILIDFDPDVLPMGAVPHDANLAEFIDEGELYDIATDLIGSFKSKKAALTGSAPMLKAWIF